MVEIEVVVELPFRHAVVFPCRDFVQVHERAVQFLCDLPCPQAEGLVHAHDAPLAALFVGVARRQAHQYGVRAQGARLAHEAAQVFAVAEDRLPFARLLDDHVQRVGGRYAAYGGPCAARVEGAVVVVPQFDDDVVARPYALLHVGPQAAVEGATAGAAQCLVLHGDLVFVEVFVGIESPAPLAVVAVAQRAGAHGGVADQEEHGVEPLRLLPATGRAVLALSRESRVRSTTLFTSSMLSNFWAPTGRPARRKTGMMSACFISSMLWKLSHRG